MFENNNNVFDSTVNMNRLVIFDMDGTLANTSPNIFQSYIHVAHELMIDEPDVESLYGALGGPLPDNISKLYGLDEIKTKEAVDIYRSYYSTLPAVQPYDGMLDVIRLLKNIGCTLAVATLKREDFAKDLLDKWGISDYFSVIVGSNQDDSISKTMMIEKCLMDTGFSNNDAIMIGDSISDYESAKNAHVPFIAASYGFSLPSGYCLNNGIQYVTDPVGILNLLAL